MTELDQRKLAIVTLFKDFPNGMTFQTVKTKKDNDKYKHLGLPTDQQILATLISGLVQEGKLVTWVANKQKYMGIAEPTKVNQQKIVNKKETIKKEEPKKMVEVVEVVEMVEMAEAMEVRQNQSAYSVCTDKPKLIQFLSDFISSSLFSFERKQDLQEIRADLQISNKDEKLRLLTELSGNEFLSEEIRQNLTAIKKLLTSMD